MAYTGTIVAVAEMQFMAGELRDATGDVEANHNYLAFYAEAYLSALVQYDIVTNWGTLNSKYKPLFTEFAARMAAVALIQYNMAGYTSRQEAEDMINTHNKRLIEIENLLKNESVQNFMGV